jgi:hypothetical protein
MISPEQLYLTRVRNDSDKSFFFIPSADAPYLVTRLAKPQY